jgi:hypothetical protein
MDKMSQIVSVLRCPLTGEHLRVVDDDESNELRRQLSRGALGHLTGSEVRDEFDSFLRTDRRPIYYPLKEGIVVSISISHCTEGIFST